jgi:trehalose 6-phosphate synthase/phosphatase
VSLRLPLTMRRTAGTWQAQPSSGGLVAALGPLADGLDAQWIGWAGEPGEREDSERQALLDTWRREHGFVAVDLEPGVARGFYEGYSNATLWPLLHGFPGRIEFDSRTFEAYRAANERFAEEVVQRYRPGDLIWIHDYQLALVPELVRARLPDAAIGLFLHVPFPASEIFRILPDRAVLLRGLLGADFLGFQTHGDVHAFRRTVLEVLGRTSRLDQVELDDRTVALAALPVGIVGSEWTRRLGEARVQARIRDRREERATATDRRTLLSVDRLDYTKGIPERLIAYRELLRREPSWRGRVQLIQVAVPSRERVPRYAELRRRVSELVGDINGEFGTADWTPVAYLRRTVPADELTVLYATADVAWVSPLRDGMNLVAKEYVTCQGDGAGVLVVSEFAGAAQELGEALRVNPYDIDGSVETIARALTMPEAERRTRQAALLARVRRNDAAAWSERFLEGLRAAAAERVSAMGVSAPAAPQGDILAAAADAPGRAFYLDYDGTLVPIAARPADAAPTPAVLDTLARLARDPRNRVVLLSGRPATELEPWFAGIDGLWFAAEHGALIREPGSDAWQPLHAGATTAWKPAVRALLEHVTDRAPGSFIEDKQFGLAWHYRLADPEFAALLARELGSLLEQQLTGTDLVVLAGRRVVEVRHGWANKGEAALAIRARGAADPPAFELAMGDDRTDEDLFERLPETAWTIHVGRGSSRARFRTANAEAAVDLLASIARATSGPRARASSPKAAHAPTRRRARQPAAP